MAAAKFKEGDFVKSKYKKQWTGVVIDSWFHKYDGRKHHVYKILLLKDASGNPYSKRTESDMGEGWLKPVEPFDISNVEPSWFTETKRRTSC